jgi:glycosyltransferase involved in cell wall biosynthesis
MKVSGFTFVRNAILYDYPILEAIQSILPLCDELVVAVGNSEDKTLELIQSIPDSKIRIIETIWDDSLREGGAVLAVETQKAFEAIATNSDWAFYIQGDEVIHEKYIPVIREAMQTHLENKKVDGLLFHYKHFYGSYQYTGNSSSWYPHEIRVIRNDKAIYSYRDAQGFRKNKNSTPQGEKLSVKKVEAWVYHYGWVKEPRAMQEKQKTFQKLWHSNEEAKKRAGTEELYHYEKNLHSLSKFEDTHPAVMQSRVKRLNWDFKYDPKLHKKTAKERFKQFCKKVLGLNFNYQNYKVIP